MILARVSGNVVSTVKNEHLKGHKLMLVRRVSLKGESIDDNDTVALDLISSGPGDLVLVVQEGDAVQQILGHANAPVHTMIVGHVDKLEVNE